MDFNERGMALVMVLLATGCILVIAALIATKVLQSRQGVATVGLQRKLFYAAAAGVEHARKRLDETYVASNYWSDYLTGNSGLLPETFRECAALAPGPIGSSPTVPVSVWVRDNNDGDGDPAADTDLRLIVVAEATWNGAGSRVEAVLIHDGGSGTNYSQLGGGARRTNYRDAAGIDDVVNAAEHIRIIRGDEE